VIAPSDEPKRDATLLLLKQRMRGLFRLLPKALAGDEEVVHQMRVSGRRLRVALLLLARKPGGRRARRALAVLRSLTRAAGTGRDLDVGVALLDSIPSDPGRSDRPLVRRRLHDARYRSRHRMAEALLDVDIAGLRRDLRRIADRGTADLVSVLDRIEAMSDTLGGSILAGLERAQTSFEPEALHRVRRQARRLRYAAEVTDLLRGSSSEAPGLLKHVQERIGALHDNHVLAARLAALASRPRAANDAMRAEARILSEWFESRCRACHRELVESEPTARVAAALESMIESRSAA
jgi:CHAD domain-containing protein